jgi:hypothetical protein
MSQGVNMISARHFSMSAILSIVIGLLGAGGLLPSSLGLNVVVAAEIAAFDDDRQTFDRLHLTDGRVLEGKIVEETRTSIIFRIVDRAIGLSVTREIDRRDIREIERDIPLAIDRPDDEPLDDDDDESAPQVRERPDRPRGLGEGDPNDESLPSFYIIPMEGQLGTDIHPIVYRGVLEDIRRVRPDVVVWRMKCADVSEEVLDLIADEVMIEELRDPNRSIEFLMDDYRELVRMLQDEMPRDIHQVMWVHDSLGVSSLIALAWEEMYMTPSARLGGIRRLATRLEEIGDEDVREKMLSATLGTVSGFLHRGNRDEYADILARAMVLPRYKLSASWHGREVNWFLDTSGDYIVNNSTESTAEFRAKRAEDFAISRGTAESLDDLALLLGFREYRVLRGDSHDIIDRHVQGWRRDFRRARALLIEYSEYREIARGDQAMQYLGRALDNLRRVIAAMKRNPVVEIRFQVEFGSGILFHLEMLEEQLRDQITRMRRGGRGPGGGGDGPRRPGGAPPPR